MRMSGPQIANATRGRRTLGAWWLVPLGYLVVSAAIEVALTLGWVFWPSTIPTFSLFFSDFTHMKIWLATAALALATLQLIWAARIYRLVRFPPSDRFYAFVHRWAGRITLLLTLPIAYHCIIIAGQVPIDARVLTHMILGAFFYGAVAAKLLIVRRTGVAGWLIPIAGGLIFTLLLGLWLTSVPWWVSIYGWSL
jgi:hypothetical protein